MHLSTYAHKDPNGPTCEGIDWPKTAVLLLDKGANPDAKNKVVMEQGWMRQRGVVGGVMGYISTRKSNGRLCFR